MQDDNARVAAFAAEWYRNLDEHVPPPVLAALVVEEGLEFVVPEGTLRTREEFTHWYAGGDGFPGVINVFFDETHTVMGAEPTFGEGRVNVEVVVNWQFRRWHPPAPRSEWGGFDVSQSWELVPGPTPEGFLVARYVVTEMKPMPGSVPLVPAPA